MFRLITTRLCAAATAGTAASLSTKKFNVGGGLQPNPTFDMDVDSIAFTTIETTGCSSTDASGEDFGDLESVKNVNTLRNPTPLPKGVEKIKADVMRNFIGSQSVSAAPSSSSALSSPSSSSSAAAATANNKFAVVMVNNLQYKVSPGDVISCQRLGAAIGSKIALKKVLLVGGTRFTAIGRPLLANCRIIAEVEEHKRFKGTTHFTHYKGRHFNRLHYREHAVTMLRIVEISYDPQIVGEIDRSTGILLPAEQSAPATEPMPNCYYADELPAKEKTVTSAAAGGKK